MTASLQAYADEVLDTLEKEFKKEKYLTDQEKQRIESYPVQDRGQVLQDLKKNQKLIDFRLYRENCYKTLENIYVKDLRILKNKDLR